MCRFLAYRGEPIFLADLVCAPLHSLVHQSFQAKEAKTATNGDGSGIGWYGERPEPGLYREARPAWSDENLRSLCQQVRSRLFFAHVRASTGSVITRSNCHPFAHANCFFMHNGQVGGYPKIKRRIETLIPDALYDARLGTTDSEALFLLAMANGLRDEPVSALAQTLQAMHNMMTSSSIEEPLRVTAAFTDGESLVAIRWASDDKPPSLYYRETGSGLIVVSEPVDRRKQGWCEVPNGYALVSSPACPLSTIRLSDVTVRLAA